MSRLENYLPPEVRNKLLALRTASREVAVQVDKLLAPDVRLVSRCCGAELEIVVDGLSRCPECQEHTTPVEADHE